MGEGQGNINEAAYDAHQRKMEGYDEWLETRRRQFCDDLLREGTVLVGQRIYHDFAIEDYFTDEDLALLLNEFEGDTILLMMKYRTDKKVAHQWHEAIREAAHKLSLFAIKEEDEVDNYLQEMEPDYE